MDHESATKQRASKPSIRRDMMGVDSASATIRRTRRPPRVLGQKGRQKGLKILPSIVLS